eukprot:TRINITY_DN3888_c1_g1_i1.p1 TRINITY_DN3888_c1_g1~~TRINITY_DN3888_c1_g1_i1.p1  ORF type:complete len:272 (+),score=51.20 TRINITY_DN3888_c1_g1_i1:208-1023(+)
MANLKRLVLSDGRTLAFREYGAATGLAVVFAHGNLNSRMFSPMWDTTQDVTEKCGVRLIAVDRPGYGGSTFLEGRTYRSFGEDVRQLMQSLELDKIAMLGYSSGGPNVLGAASVLGDKVLCCGLFSSDGPYKEMGINVRMFGKESITQAELVERAKGNADELRAAYQKAKPERVAMLMSDLDTALEQGPEAGPSQDGWLESRDWGIDLSAVTCPVLLYHGDQDADVPHQCSEYLAKQLPNAQLCIFEGENHSLIRRKWEQVLHSLVSTSSC